MRFEQLVADKGLFELHPSWRMDHVSIFTGIAAFAVQGLYSHQLFTEDAFRKE